MPDEKLNSGSDDVTNVRDMVECFLIFICWCMLPLCFALSFLVSEDDLLLVMPTSNQGVALLN